MTITQRLMKPGAFSIRLREDYPWSVGASVRTLDHLVVLPGQLSATSDLDDAAMLASAIYTGVVTSKPSPRIFEGYDPSWWLGTPDGLGAIGTSSTTRSAATLSTWVSGLLPDAILAGAVTNTGLGTHSATYVFITPREELDAVCRALGAEWRVNPDFTIDAAKSPDLFVASPTTIITRGFEGQDGDLRAISGDLLVVGSDVEQYTTKVIAVASGWGYGVTAATATGSTSFKDPWNNAVELERVVDVATESLANAGAVAASQLAIWNQERFNVSLSSRTYHVTRFAKPGDYVYVFDQRAGLVDDATQVELRGEMITPMTMRVNALTWPLERGMAVYVRRSGVVPTYFDLTDFIEWEDGTSVVWDVTTAKRSSGDAGIGPTSGVATFGEAREGATAYLGANASVAGRATSSSSAWRSYTPTVTNFTKGNGSIGGSYVVDANNMCDFEVSVVLGSTSAVTGGMTVTLPLASITSGPPPIGQVEFYIGGIGAGYMHFNGGAPTIFTPCYISSLAGALTQFGVGAPAAWGTGNGFWARGRYRVA